MTSGELRKARKEQSHRLAVEEELKSIFKNDLEGNDIWKDIPNFEGIYQVSNLGKVRQLPCVYRSSKGILVRRKLTYLEEKELRGYLQTRLIDIRGRHYLKGTHRWVMMAFHGDSDLQVDHINGVKDDNRLENLRYVNNSDNINHVKTLNPEKYTSELHGVYLHKGRWISNFTANGICYHLGMFDTDLDGHEAYKVAKYNWEELGVLPEKVRPAKYSSRNLGLGFHKLSGKWRVRVNRVYFGLFKVEDEALRVYNIAKFLHSRGRTLDKELVEKIKKKYTNDDRFKKLYVHLPTGYSTNKVSKFAKYLGVDKTSIYLWIKNGKLEEKGIVIEEI